MPNTSKQQNRINDGRGPPECPFRLSSSTERGECSEDSAWVGVVALRFRTMVMYIDVGQYRYLFLSPTNSTWFSRARYSPRFHQMLLSSILPLLMVYILKLSEMRG